MLLSTQEAAPQRQAWHFDMLPGGILVDDGSIQVIRISHGGNEADDCVRPRHVDKEACRSRCLADGPRVLGQQKEGQGFIARNRGGKITGSTRPGKQPEVIGSEPELLLDDSKHISHEGDELRRSYVLLETRGSRMVSGSQC